METDDKFGIIPRGGSGKDITIESERIDSDLSSAAQTYQRAKRRLLDVNHWHELAGKFAHFQLVNAEGNDLDEIVKNGDYIKINIVGPGPEAGEGDDWVRVEDFVEYTEKSEEIIGFRVKPNSNPTVPEDKSIAHFYSKQSSSSFTVTRKMEKVTVGIYDKNVEVNTESDRGFDMARNAVFGAIAITFFSKIQWKLLAEGILED